MGSILRRGPLAAIGLALVLFLAVYLPAFTAVGILRIPPARAVPVVIALTFLIALALVAALSRRYEGGIGSFGMKGCALRQVAWSLGLGAAAGSAVALGTWLIAIRTPFGGAEFTPVEIVAYFWIGASIQEEIVFRGLIQSALQRRITGTVGLGQARLSLAVLIAAILFGLIHLPLHPYIAAGATLLGLIAGELRRRSGSLIPAVLVHMLFNIAGSISELL